MRTFSFIDSDIRDKLKIIWQAEPLPPLAFAAHPRVRPETVAKLRDAMVEMSNNPAGVSLLKAINFSGIVSATDRDFVKARGFDMPTLEVQI